MPFRWSVSKVKDEYNVRCQILEGSFIYREKLWGIWRSFFLVDKLEAHLHFFLLREKLSQQSAIEECRSHSLPSISFTCEKTIQIQDMGSRESYRGLWLDSFQIPSVATHLNATVPWTWIGWVIVIMRSSVGIEDRMSILVNPMS